MKHIYASIELKPGVQKAGIVKVQVAPREWQIADPVIDFNTCEIITPVTLAAGRSWITLEFTPSSYDYEEKDKSSKGGSLFQLILSGNLNNYDAEVQQTIESLRYHELVAIVMDRNKRKKLVGTTEAGLVLTFSNRTQNASGGQQTNSLEMMMLSEAPAPFYSV